MANTITIPRGDTAPAFEATLHNADGPQDLTGATAKLRIERARVNGETFEADCVIDADPTTGTVRYQWQEGETDIPPGKYDVEVRVTYADTTVQTFPNEGSVQIVIREPKTSTVPE